MLTLYKSMIRSYLEYCCPLWHPYDHIANTQTLESVQRLFTSKLQGYGVMDYWSRLKALRLISLERRRERYIIIYIWKIIQGLAPNDLNIAWYFNDRSGIRVRIPRHKSNGILKNTIAVIGPRLWNTLPKEVSLEQSLIPFKSGLQCFLKTIPDITPTKRYPYSRNSILDYMMNKNYYLSAQGGQRHCTA